MKIKKIITMYLTLIISLNLFNFLVNNNVSAYGMNTSLGTVDASFTGENDGNSSVTEVSIIGDVNNDGYDEHNFTLTVFNVNDGVREGQGNRAIGSLIP